MNFARLNIVLLVYAFSHTLVFGQGVFESNTTDGDWISSGSWTLVSGTDFDGVPDSDDNVTILSGDQINIRNNQNCDDLAIAGTLNFSRNSRSLTVGGNLTMSGTTTEVVGDGSSRELNVSGTFNVTSGAIADINGITITVTGTTTLDGTLNFLDITGNKTFGNIAVNNGGTWGNGTVTTDFTINGDLTVDGTFTGCSTSVDCVYSLRSSAGSISGTSTISISDLDIDAPAAYTNTATVIITDELRGTGSFTNGTSASLELQEGGPFDITTFDASTNSNSVTYTEGITVNILPGTYYNLVINKTADASLVGDVTINNVLTLTNGNLVLGTNRLTVTSDATISGGGVSSYVEIASTGRLRQNYTAAGSTLSFPIGDNNHYSPITGLRIISATFGSGAYLEFDIVDLNHPNRNNSNTGSGGDDTGTSSSDRISRYWTLTPNNITSPRFDATYVYDDVDVSGTEANMVATIYRIHPSLGISDWLSSGIVNPTNNTVSLVNADAFGDLYAMDNSAARLPIALLSFNAKIDGDRVNIHWSTLTEINNEFFTVERSRDGLNFEPVIFKEGAGNSLDVRHYSATDIRPLPGRSYYRLKQTDFDGSFGYSPVVSVVNLDAGNVELAFKNLVSPGEIIPIKVKGQVINKVSLILLDGRVLGEWIIDELGGFDLAMPFSAPPGLCLLLFEGNRGIKTHRVMVKH